MAAATHVDLEARLKVSANAILAALPEELRHPTIAIVCGSGLSGLADQIQDKVLVSYSDIGFTKATVAGHASSLAFGYLSSKRIPVVAQLGRFHAYEGHPLEDVVFPMRVFGYLGVKIAIMTNAAGGLHPDMTAGYIVALRDHISFPSMTSWNPLVGPNVASLGPRFPPMSDAYDFELRKSAFMAAALTGLPDDLMHEGIYGWVSGPTYETPAEAKFLETCGADVVGMSKWHDKGIRVLVLSLVTNIVVRAPYRDAKAAAKAELEGKPVKQPEVYTASHEEVLEMGRQKANDMRKLVEKIVEMQNPGSS